MREKAIYLDGEPKGCKPEFIDGTWKTHRFVEETWPTHSENAPRLGTGHYMCAVCKRAATNHSTVMRHAIEVTYA